MSAIRHRWNWSEKQDGSGKCKHCGLKTAVKKVPDGRPGRQKNKVEKQMYCVGGEWVPTASECNHD